MADTRGGVFFSYVRTEYRLAEPLIAALRAQGLRVFVDRHDVRDFSSISESLSGALAESTLLVALYSPAYLSRSSCNFELTAAFLAGQREGDPCRRIAVISPTSSFEHVHPMELRDRRSFSLADHLGREDELAAAIARRAGEVGGTIGPPPEGGGVRWFPAPPLGRPEFQPFRRRLWEAHSALRPGAASYHTGRWEGGSAWVSSLDAGTATAFCHAYAFQFGAAYPGGVYWLDLAGEAGDAAQGYARRVRELARAAGAGDGSAADPVELHLSRIAERMDRDGGRSLWVVDGLPGAAPEAHRPLRNPHPSGSTLLTGFGRGGDGLGEEVDITDTGEQAALELLTRDHGPIGRPGGEERAAEQVVRLLGGTPVALSAARRLLPSAPAEIRYQQLEQDLRDPGHDVLDYDPAYRGLADRLCADVAALPEEARALVVWACRRAPPAGARGRPGPGARGARRDRRRRRAAPGHPAAGGAGRPPLRAGRPRGPGGQRLPGAGSGAALPGSRAPGEVRQGVGGSGEPGTDD
ncbi:toll/interleukin-1 receptor domain-containing protein [Nocardiopsis composta]|uniref:TIR domain-containing protein n=1 Tax=Nocardiopsis composta TaxID=157465 RepID=A0A7W8QQC6_9ACTN|nr:toll/interleukin-1 receptor domain-containing protein [Nocardiopsis composta]MBB5434668.1 hypothetical protein [Nocardiopsis composta]